MAAGELLGKPDEILGGSLVMKKHPILGGYDTLSCLMLWKPGLALAGWVA